MYLWIVVLLLIILTMFYYMREGLESEHILDKSTILATETEVQLPNRVSGIRGNDITFTGDIQLENTHSLELGKGVEKGINSGKIRYTEDKLEIFGAGKEETPYRMKLWDNVEVGGLLQVNEGVQFGKDETQGGIEYGTEDNQLHVKGYGADGTRKVKIWDEVEVGKLLSKKGVDVYGPLNAYNVVNVAGNLGTAGNMIVKGKMVGKSGLSVVGDVDITGNIANPPLDQRMNDIEKNLTENMNKNSTLEVGIIPGIRKEVDNLKEKNAEVLTELERVKDKLKEVSQRTPPPFPTTTPPLPTLPSVGMNQFNASFEQLKLDLQHEIAAATSTLTATAGPTTVATTGAATGAATGPVGVNSKDLDDWVKTRNLLFSTPEQIEAWTKLSGTGSGLTSTQLKNLEPLKNESFNTNLLEIGNNARVNYTLLADIASDGSLDYFKDLDEIVEYLGNGMSTINTNMAKLNTFSNEWLDERYAANDTNKLTATFIKILNDANSLSENVETITNNTNTLINGNTTAINELRERVNNLKTAAATASSTGNANANTNVNKDAIDELERKINALDMSAVKKDSNGNVNVPGKLMLGKMAGQMWNFIAGSNSVAVTKQT